MAAKQTKSRAEQAVSAKLKKSKTGKGKLTTKKDKGGKTQTKPNQSSIPVRLINSTVCLGLFVLLLIILHSTFRHLSAIFFLM